MGIEEEVRKETVEEMTNYLKDKMFEVDGILEHAVLFHSED